MDFRVLGVLELRRGDRWVSLEAPKMRALLAILLIHAGEAVSRQALIEAIWDEHPPRRAANALQVYVLKLRQAIAGGGHDGSAVHSSRHGYRLEIGGRATDALCFEALIEEARRAEAGGDPARAVRLLDEALGLWHGEPYADLAEAPFAEPERARLQELRLLALEQRIGCELRLGHHQTLIAELAALIREHPLQERLREHLMVALYRSGRQAEALDLYESTHRMFVAERGIVPGPDLRRLQEAILRQDAALEEL